MARCPDPSVLEGLFQGTLASTQRAELERHLDSCSACAQTVSELARLFGSASWGPEGAAVRTARTITIEQDSVEEPRPRHGPPSVDLGRYRLGPRLGAGGMGMVFEAHDPELDRRVAIKLLHPGLSADAEQTRDRLMHEARAMARLAHPNVVAVYDVGRAGEQVFLAMELVEGSTLTRWLEAKPRRTLEAILAVFIEAGRGLEAAHGVGLVHRDFKPDNVLVGTQGRARVTDFGLAMPAIAGAQAGVHVGATVDMRSSTTVQTEHGAIVGTPAYMAPEQWQGLPADARSDQFSFCVALYEALFERRPFPGEDMQTLSLSVREHEPQPPPRSAPRWLRQALARGLSKRPAARYPSMRALLDVLERDRKRALRIAAVAGAMGLSAIATVGVFAWTSSEAERADRGPHDSSNQASPAAAAKPREPREPPLHSERERCETAAQARGWTAAGRGSFEAHMLDMEDGEQLAKRVMPTLDTWLDDWRSLAKQACEHDAQDLDLLARCLDAKLARFDALVLRAPEFRGFQIASALPWAALGLPALDWCTNPTKLAATPAPPSSEQTNQAKLLQGDIAALEALIGLQRWGDARDEADHVIELATELGYAPLLAEAQLARGRIAADEHLPATARTWFEAAAEAAQAGAHQQVLGEAAIALITELGANMLVPEHAKRWQRVASTQADRHEDPGLGGRAALAEARVLAAIGEYKQARERLEDAQTKLHAGYGEAHPSLIRLEIEQANVELALADLEGAAAAAEAGESLALALLGPEALLYAEAKAARARVYLAQGALDQAESLAAEATKIPGVGRSIRHDYDHGVYLGLRGEIALARGAPAIAREQFEDAKVYFYQGPEEALPLLWLGALDIHEGQTEAGLAALELALTKLEPQWGPDDLRRLAMLRDLGLAQLEAGALTRARATLEATLALADEGLGFGPLQAFAQVDLARVELAAGDQARALALLDDAFVAMAGGLDHTHPRVVEATLTRADLAWELGKRDYASTLYRGVASDLEQQRGAQDPATSRAMSRKAPDQ